MPGTTPTPHRGVHCLKNCTQRGELRQSVHLCALKCGGCWRWGDSAVDANLLQSNNAKCIAESIDCAQLGATKSLTELAKSAHHKCACISAVLGISILRPNGHGIRRQEDLYGTASSVT